MVDRVDGGRGPRGDRARSSPLGFDRETPCRSPRSHFCPHFRDYDDGYDDDDVVQACCCSKISLMRISRPLFF